MRLLPLFFFGAWLVLMLATVLYYANGQLWNQFGKIAPDANFNNSFANTIQREYMVAVSSTGTNTVIAMIALTLIMGIAEISLAFEKPERLMGIAGIASMFVIAAMWITIKWIDVSYLLPIFVGNPQFLGLFDSVWFITAVEFLMAAGTILHFRKSPKDSNMTVIYRDSSGGSYRSGGYR